MPVEIGTIAGWITAGGVWVMVAAWLRFLPQWIKARSDQRKTDSDLATQFRDELFAKLHDCEESHKKLRRENEKLAERIVLLEDGDRRKTIALSLVMNELTRLDPTSDILIRAKGVLEVTVNLTPSDEKMLTAIHILEDRE